MFSVCRTWIRDINPRCEWGVRERASPCWGKGLGLQWSQLPASSLVSGQRGRCWNLPGAPGPAPGLAAPQGKMSGACRMFSVEGKSKPCLSPRGLFLRPDLLTDKTLMYMHLVGVNGMDGDGVGEPGWTPPTPKASTLGTGMGTGVIRDNQGRPHTWVECMGGTMDADAFSTPNFQAIHKLPGLNQRPGTFLRL